MSILRFLGIVDASGLLAERPAAPPRQRKLALETLDSRALLTLFTPIVVDTVAGLVETPPLPAPDLLDPITGDPDPGSWVEDPPQDPPPDPYAGSGGGEGGDPPPETDPPPEPLTGSGGGSGGGSAGGEGGDPPVGSGGGSGGGSAGGEGGDPPVGSGGGSGSGSGEGQPPTDTDPVISSVTYFRTGSLVLFAGRVTDDGPLGNLTVYISSDQGQSFTAQTTVMGTFASMFVSINVGAQISIYTIDSTGNQSDTYLLLV